MLLPRFCVSLSPCVSAAMLRPLPLVAQGEPPLALGGAELLELEVGDDEVGRLLDRLEDVDEPVADDVDLRRAARALPRQLQVGKVPRVPVLLGLSRSGILRRLRYVE